MSKSGSHQAGRGKLAASANPKVPTFKEQQAFALRLRDTLINAGVTPPEDIMWDKKKIRIVWATGDDGLPNGWRVIENNPHVTRIEPQGEGILNFLDVSYTL